MCDDIPCFTVFDGLLLLEEDADLFTSSQASGKGLSISLGDESGGSVPYWVRCGEGSCGGLGGDVVVDNDGNRASFHSGANASSKGGGIGTPGNDAYQQIFTRIEVNPHT
jgi:hypothetical protein